MLNFISSFPKPGVRTLVVPYNRASLFHGDAQSKV